MGSYRLLSNNLIIKSPTPAGFLYSKKAPAFCGCFFAEKIKECEK
nr:MAG TPA: hypothetical protein [Caudoviricetes sp.]